MLCRDDRQLLGKQHQPEGVARPETRLTEQTQQRQTLRALGADTGLLELQCMFNNAAEQGSQ